VTKPVLAYIDHSYHRKTNSNAFLLDALRQRYEVSIVWDESWLPSGPRLSVEHINALQPDVVLFFQTLLNAKDLRKIHCELLFHVPMHDHVVGNPKFGWNKFKASGMRSINFCQATHRFFCALGYDSTVVQYWPEAQLSNIAKVEGLRLFFWPRRREIGWSVVKALLGEARPDQIVLRTSPDPGESPDMPSEDEIRDYKIKVVSGWLEKADYVELLTSCNVFVAPRLYEGIGQAFLEAMSLGLAVIAPDQPTMNEYIHDGVNGYLYSAAAPKAVNFANLTAVRQRSLQSVAEGHAAWHEHESTILNYLASTPKKRASFAWRLKRLLNI
jgi:glycosyltransferase involved in cell wall biosynthesis